MSSEGISSFAKTRIEEGIVCGGGLGAAPVLLFRKVDIASSKVYFHDGEQAVHTVVRIRDLGKKSLGELAGHDALRTKLEKHVRKPCERREQESS